MCLAILVIFAVVDAARSIGASAVLLTPLAESWDGAAPGTREALSGWLTNTVHPVLADPVLTTIADWPTVAVFGGLALFFGLIGQPRQRRSRFVGR